MDLIFESLDSFQEIRMHFEIWAPERQRVLKELNIIKDEIQRQARIHTIGSITYSSVGLVGGGLAIAGIVTAPFTFGASLALTVAGVATGVTSGVAGLTHGVVKIGLVRKHCNIAKESLKKHEEACRKMKELITWLKTDIEEITSSIRKTTETGVENNDFEIIEENITIDIEMIEAGMKNGYSLKISRKKQGLQGLKQSGSAAALGKSIASLVESSQAVSVYRLTGCTDEVAKVLRLGAALEDIVPSAFKDVSKGVAKLSTEALSVLAAVGIIIDLGSLIWNAVDLAKIEKGQLCTEAEKLQEVIEKMQHEYDVLNKIASAKCFNDL